MAPTLLRNVNKSPHHSARTGAVVLSLAILFALASAVTPAAQAQTFKVLYSFQLGLYYSGPYLTAIDPAGNFFGFMGNYLGQPAVYRLLTRDSGWLLSFPFTFSGGNDGFDIEYPLTPGPDGRLYGVTREGGVEGYCGPYQQFQGCGTVFVITPPPAPCASAQCQWTKTILYKFNDQDDGAIPSSPLSFDGAGNLYGSTSWGGYTDQGNCWAGCGTVYKLSPNGSGWTFEVVYASQGPGSHPEGGLTLDSGGDIYLTNGDSVFELMCCAGGFSYKSIYTFTGGEYEDVGVMFDRAGNLYGVTQYYGNGTVFQLTPAEGEWTESELYKFTSTPYCIENVTVDAAGNVNGTICGSGRYGYGYAYRLTPTVNGWTFTSLHDFTDGEDGEFPDSLMLDAKGNLWGTSDDGAYGYGVVWEITP
jgi:hypothetical protein